MAPQKPQDPKLEAERVLLTYWADLGLPVDPVRIATGMGVDVKSAELPPEVSGALVKSPGADPVILLSASDHPNRQRFSCAHELGHFVRHSGQDEYDYIDLRGPLAATGENEEERFANRFAANLLMPERKVREQALRSEPNWLSAKRFGVSPEAMKWRLKYLGLVACNC